MLSRGSAAQRSSLENLNCSAKAIVAHLLAGRYSSRANRPLVLTNIDRMPIDVKRLKRNRNLPGPQPTFPPEAGGEHSFNVS